MSDDDIPELEDCSAQIANRKAQRTQLDSARFTSKKTSAPKQQDSKSSSSSSSSSTTSSTSHSSSPSSSASSSTSTSSSASPPKVFHVGAKVRIDGLKSAQYNGLTGKVVSAPDGNSGRVGISVTLQGAVKTLALQQSNLSVLPKSTKVTSTPVASKSDASKSSAISSAAREAARKAANLKEAEMPYVKGAGSRKANAKESLQMPEVQEALKDLKEDKSWMTTDFLSKIMTDPYFVNALKDPRLVAAMSEIAEDPQAAMKKYSGNVELETFIRKFMGLMGTQLTDLATTKEAEQKEAERKAKGPMVQFGEREVPQADLNRWMSDPRIRAVLDDPRTGQMLNLIQKDERNFEKFRNMPQMQMLLREGVIMTPPRYQL